MHTIPITRDAALMLKVMCVYMRGLHKGGSSLTALRFHTRMRLFDCLVAGVRLISRRISNSAIEVADLRKSDCARNSCAMGAECLFNLGLIEKSLSAGAAETDEST